MIFVPKIYSAVHMTSQMLLVEVRRQQEPLTQAKYLDLLAWKVGDLAREIGQDQVDQLLPYHPDGLTVDQMGPILVELLWDKIMMDLDQSQFPVNLMNYCPTMTRDEMEGDVLMDWINLL